MVTDTSVNASMTTFGAGTGSSGPMKSCSVIPLSILRSRDSLRQRDANLAADGVGQFIRADRTVGIADTPELLGVAQIFRREIVETVALNNCVLLDQRELLWRRHEAALEINDRAANCRCELGSCEAVISAVGRKFRSVGAAGLQHRLQRLRRVGHGMPRIPRRLGAPPT